MTVILILVGALGMVTKGPEKTEGIGSQRKIRDHPDHSMVYVS